MSKEGEVQKEGKVTRSSESCEKGWKLKTGVSEPTQNPISKFYDKAASRGSQTDTSDLPAQTNRSTWYKQKAVGKKYKNCLHHSTTTTCLLNLPDPAIEMFLQGNEEVQNKNHTVITTSHDHPFTT